MPQTKPISWLSIITLLSTTLMIMVTLTKPTNFTKIATPQKLITKKQMKW